MKMFRFIAAVLLISGCAHPGSNNPTEYNAGVITEAEIDASGAQTAYDAVKKLRSNFLSSRGKTTINNPNAPEEPVVFLDNHPFGPLSALKTIPANQVGEIRLFRSWEATTKFGSGYTAGVIAVTTRQ